MLVRPVVLALLLPLLFSAPAGAAPATLSETGAAGDWLVYYQPFLSPATGVGVSATLEVATASPLGEPVSLFVLPPLVVYDRSPTDRGLYDLFASASVVTQAAGGPLTRDVSTGASMGSSGLMGVVVAVAASHAWTADLTIDVAANAPLGAPVVLRGSDARFASAAAVATPGAGRSELTMDIATPGWTHLAAEGFHAQPVGVRSYDVRFPNGYRFAGTGTMTGANALAVGLANSNNYWGGFGATGDVPGTLTAGLTYAEASTGVNLGAVHLTGAALPSTLASLNYRTFDGGLDVLLPSIAL